MTLQLTAAHGLNNYRYNKQHRFRDKQNNNRKTLTVIVI